YLGLNYPAADIPRQARELFHSSSLRLIPDVDYVPSALAAGKDAPSVDLGRSALRSVSPVHIEYLKTMGVRASLVSALVVEGCLWGLLACHQVSGAKYFSPDVVETLEWLCQDIAALIEVTLIRQRQERAQDLARRRRNLAEVLRTSDFKTLMRPGNAEELLAVVGADGFALVTNQRIQTTGGTPSTECIRDLQRSRRRQEKDQTLFASDSLSRDLGKGDAEDGVAGAIFVSVGERPDVSLIWFRNERRHAVRWAGDPEQAHQADETGRISPRKSFAQFLENVRGQCLAWTPEELASAAELGTLIRIELLRKSVALAESAMMTMPEHLAVLDDQGMIVAVNSAWEQFAEENDAPDLAKNSIGLNYRDVCLGLDGAEGPEAWAGIEAVLDKRLERFTLDYPCHSATEQRWFQMNVAPLTPPGEGVMVVHRNLTQRKLAEIDLSAERARLHALLENVPDLVWLKDLEGRYVSCNPEFEKFFGAKEAEITGRTDFDFVDWDLAGSFRQKDTEALAADKPVINEEWITYASDGHRALLETIKSPVRDEAGNILGILGIARDITERQLARQALQQREHDLAEAQRIAHLGSWTRDVATKETIWSDEVYRIFGFSRRQHLRSYADFIAVLHPDDREAVVAAYLGSLAEGGKYDTQYRVVSPSTGEVKWCHSRCDHQRDDQGRAIRSVGTILDITEGKRLEEQLINDKKIIQSSEEQMSLSQHIGGTGSWIYTVEDAGILPSANNFSLFGMKQEVKNYFLDDFLEYVPDRDRVRQTLIAAIRDKRAYEDEFTVIPADGSDPKIIHAIGKLEKDAGGNVVSVLGFIQDITKIRKIEEALKHSNAELEQFAYVASHDLRQPLRMVSQYLEIIGKQLGPELDDNLKRYFGYAIGGAMKMDRLIIELLQYSRTGKSAESVPVCLGQTVSDALGNLMMPVRESGAQISVADDMPTVTGDQMELTRLFQNLIGNAVKYRTPDRPPKVAIDWRRQARQYLVWVKDNGIGIAPADRERAFQIFQRLVPKDAYEGSGIGLSICKKIVELHGGKIWIESDLGVGSTFFMTFPAGTG
ncbi:MAG TPA: PAS domain S-box protein, partial [Rhodospirillaceae bacterium]|nr:PAS domain S-box protein [Rhodospirillaceae bacterium]